MVQLQNGDMVSRAKRLAEIGDGALAVRDFDSLSQTATRLSEIPVRGAYEAGVLFAALCDTQTPDNRARGVKALQAVSEIPSPNLRARANLALGTDELRHGNPDSAFTFYQAAQLGDSLSRFLAYQMTAAGLDAIGEKGTAKRILESIESLAFHLKQFYPVYFYNYLNSRAVVEGDLEMAAVPATSPYSVRYPEWVETYGELRERLPIGLVSVPALVHDAVLVSEAERRVDARCRIARVIDNPIRTAFELEGCAGAVERLTAETI